MKARMMLFTSLLILLLTACGPQPHGQPEIVAVTTTPGVAVLATATETAMPSPLPTIAPSTTPLDTNMPQADNGTCRLDKISTANEIYDQNRHYVGPQRMEIGGNGIQHADVYPAPGVQAVSYIIPRQEPIEVYGHGSIWEAPNDTACASFDFVHDATEYTKERLNQNHSGLVVDMRTGFPQIVANLRGLTDQQITNLMYWHAQSAAGHNVAITDAVGITEPRPLPGFDRDATPVPVTPSATRVITPTMVATTAPTQAPQQNCTGTTERHNPTVGTPWVFTITGSAVLNFWTNEPGKNQGEQTMTLRPGSYSILGGGTLTQYATGCEAIAQQEILSNGLPQTTYETWVSSRGLATR